MHIELPHATSVNIVGTKYNLLEEPIKEEVSIVSFSHCQALSRGTV